VKRLIEKIFGTNQEPSNDISTQPITEEEISINKDAPATGDLDPPNLAVSCGQSVGKQRDHNEDSVFALTTTFTSENRNIPFGLYIVADGMGGHQHGEVASGIAIRVMAKHIVQKLYTPLLNVEPAQPDLSLQEIMQEGVQEAHQRILNQVPGGGTTLTALLILGDQLTIAHVGDSRAYRLDSENGMDALTRDHSLVKRLVELGQITMEEAAVHPQRNVLYRALGQGEPFEADIHTMHMPEHGYLLVCSDGLWGVVPEEDIYRMITSTPNLDEACEALIESANKNGGPDNISAILVRLPN
jgi:serine/threonine protein phosphatase PrpC